MGGFECRVLATSLKAQGRWSEAIDAYRRFEASNGTYADYAVQLAAHAECARKIGDPVEERHVYALLVRYVSDGPLKSPESVGLGDLTGPNANEAMARAAEAMTLVGRGEFRSAADGYRAALKLRPDYAAAHFGLARALAFEGKGAEASAEMQRAARGDHPGVRARALQVIAGGVSGTNPQSTLSPEHQRLKEARDAAGKTGPILP